MMSHLNLRRRHPYQITEILYDMVTQVLGGKSVKCVLNDDDSIFTTDIEILLSNLDIEHPEIEIILQSLKSHKALYGEGMKSFLFMVTRMMKAVKQLEELGVADRIATRVMEQAIDMLTKEVNSISLPVISLAQKELPRKLPLTKSCAANTKLLNEMSQSSKLDKEKIFEFSHHERNPSGLECLDLTPSHHGLNIEDSVFSRDKCCDHWENSTPSELCSREELSNPNEFVCQLGKSPRDYFDSHEEKPILNESGHREEKSSQNDFGRHKEKYDLKTLESCADIKSENNESVSIGGVMECDTVFLKMSGCSIPSGTDQDDDFDDIDWFFDKQRNFSVESESQGRSDLEKSLGTLSKHLGDQVLSIVDGEKYTSSELQSDFVEISINGEQKSDLASKQDSHDSDFEDCFDDFDDTKNLNVVVESTNVNPNPLISNVNESNLLGDIMIGGVTIPKLHTEKDVVCKSSNQIESDEFDESFSQESGDLICTNLESSQLPNTVKGAPLDISMRLGSQSDKSDLTKESPDDVKSAPASKNLSNNKSMCSSSEITQLNSLLSLLGNSKTHNVRQVMFSTRHELNEENSKDCDYKESSDSINTKELASYTKEKSIELCYNGSDPEFNFGETNPKESVANLSTKSTVSKIDDINAMLKRLSAQKSSANSTGILASSRHLKDREEVEHKNGSISSIDNSLEPKQNTNIFLKEDERSNDTEPHNTFGSNHCFKSSQESDNMKPDGEIAEANAPRWPVNIPEHIALFCRKSNHLTPLVSQVYSYQTQDGVTNSHMKRLDISKVHCVSIQSPSCVREIVRGLVIPCRDYTLEKLGSTPTKHKTLLVNGDLKPGFVHKGHKPLVAKKVVLAGDASSNSSSVGKEEHSWSTLTVDALRKLSVGVLLVKGTVSDPLRDMLDKENIIVLTKLSFRVLQIVSSSHEITPMIYVQDATMNDVCELTYQPLDPSWMDQDSDSHCLWISDLPNIQTVLLQLPSLQSCHTEEEMLWKCLHRLSNTLKDGFVLPGCGETEVWCSRRVSAMAHQWPGGFCPQTDVVLQSLADIYQDYASFVRLNSMVWDEDSPSSQGYPSNCDSLTSKVSSWSAALDLVQVLLSLELLVVTGTSRTDLSVGEVLL